MTADRNDLRSPVVIELPCKLRASGDGSKEGTGPETSTNDKSADPVSDVNKPFNKFDFWHIFDEYCCVENSTSEHNASRTPLITERGPNEPYARQRVHGINAVIAECIPNNRRVEGSRFISGVKVICPTFANDNPVSWHPLDAA